MRAGVGTLAAILVGLSSLACGDAGDLEDGVVGAVEDQPAADKADDVSVPFRVVTGGYDFGFPTAKIERETRRVFKTAGALASYFQCTTCNPGIDFSREWAVFYTPGRDALVRGSLATLRSVKLSPAGASLKVTTRHLKPGSCATERTRPFVFAAFKKPTRTPSTTRFYKDDYTRSCASSTSTNVTRAPFEIGRAHV